MDNVSKEKFLTYIKENHINTDKYYTEAYDRIIVDKKFIHWNWAAAFFGPFWLMYRRMYLEALVFVILDIFVVLLCLIFNREIVILSYYGVTFGLLGLFGTFIYLNRIKKRFVEGKNIPSSPVDKWTFHLAFWPGYVGVFLSELFSLSSAMEVMILLSLNFYFIVLLLYKYQKARRDNIV